MPALPSNTYRTPHGFQFRMVVPEPLRAAVGKREIKKSLGKDYREAVSQARFLALKVDRRFTELREQITQKKERQSALDTYLELPWDKRLKPITEVTPELVAGLRSFWLATLDADLAWRREGIDDDEYEALGENIAQAKELLAKSLARGQAEPFIPVVRNLLVGRGYELMVSPEEERKLVLDVLPAIQEGYDILEQRQAGRLVKPMLPSDPPLPAAWETPAPATGNSITWQQLLEHWHKDRERPVRTSKEVETYVNALAALLPKASPATLTRAQVTEWLRNERETRGNKAKTLEKKGTLVGALFSVAVKDELLERNPFSGFDYSRFAAKEGIEDTDEREPFTQDQLKRIFSENDGLFAITKQTGGGGYHARVWMPVIALYSGARLDEIGSLLLTDIILSPVPHFLIRRGKTQSSVREVPLHPDLIALGFLDYVKALRRAGHTRLWPHLKTKSKTADDSEVLGKWFNRFIHEKLGFPSTVVFHSFRHTFKDMCRNALIPRDIHDALTGHASETEKNVGDDYGKGFSLEVKTAQISKITLDIDISKPAPFGSARSSRRSRAPAH